MSSDLDFDDIEIEEYFSNGMVLNKYSMNPGPKFNGKLHKPFTKKEICSTIVHLFQSLQCRQINERENNKQSSSSAASTGSCDSGNRNNAFLPPAKKLQLETSLHSTSMKNLKAGFMTPIKIQQDSSEMDDNRKENHIETYSNPFGNDSILLNSTSTITSMPIFSQSSTFSFPVLSSSFINGALTSKNLNELNLQRQLLTGTSEASASAPAVTIPTARDSSSTSSSPRSCDSPLPKKEKQTHF
jgi:hypothetical protein